jgi:hypothetical protein
VFDRGRVAVLGELGDAVGPRGALGGDLADHDGLVDDRRAPRHRHAGHHHVGVADALRHPHLHGLLEGPAGAAAQPPAEGLGQVLGDVVVLGGAAHHGDRAYAVELVAQVLPRLPREELVQRHRAAQRQGHGASLARPRPRAIEVVDPPAVADRRGHV